MKNKLILTSLIILIFFTSNFSQNESRNAETTRLHSELTLFLDTKEYDKIIQITTRLIEIDPNESGVYFIRALAYYSKKNYKQTINDIDKGLELGLSGKETTAAILLKALSNFELKDYPNAIKTFSKLLERDKNDYQSFGFRALSKFYLKQYVSAIEDFDNSLRLKPNQTNLYKFRGLSNYFIEKYESAIDDLSKFISSHPKNRESYLYREKSYRKLGKTDLANKDLEQYIAQLIDAISKELKEGKFDSAIQLSLVLDDAFPHPETSKLVSSSYTARGINYVQNKELDKAIEDFRIAIRLDKSNETALLGRAKALAGMGKFDEAISEAEKVLELNPKNPYVYPILSVIYFDNEQFNQSLKFADKAISVNNENYRAILYRGFSLYRMKKYKAAEIELSRFLKKFPNDLSALTNRMFVYSALKDWKHTKNDASKILTIDDKNLEALSLRISANFALKENFKQLINDLNKIEEIDKTSIISELYKMRAIVYREIGKIKLAVADEKKASELEAKENKNR